MLKKVLTEIDLYSGNILMPDGFDINRTQIKHDIIKSFSTNKRMSDNTKDYSYQDYQLPFSKPVGWLNDYIRDHFKVEYGSTLVLKSQFGCIYKPEQQAYSRHNIDPIDLKNAPDYTFIYGVDVAKDSCELVIEYNDNSKKTFTRKHGLNCSPISLGLRLPIHYSMKHHQTNCVKITT